MGHNKHQVIVDSNMCTSRCSTIGSANLMKQNRTQRSNVHFLHNVDTQSKDMVFIFFANMEGNFTQTPKVHVFLLQYSYFKSYHLKKRPIF